MDEKTSKIRFSPSYTFLGYWTAAIRLSRWFVLNSTHGHSTPLWKLSWHLFDANTFCPNEKLFIILKSLYWSFIFFFALKFRFFFTLQLALQSWRQLLLEWWTCFLLIGYIPESERVSVAVAIFSSVFSVIFFCFVWGRTKKHVFLEQCSHDDTNSLFLFTALT